MSETIDRLKPELARLTEDERADLAHFLLSSLDAGDAGDAGAADMQTLLDRRSTELRSSAVVGVPAEEVFERLRRKYP